MTNEKPQSGRLANQSGSLDAVNDAIIVRNPGGRIVYWSQGAEGLYGWSPKQALGNAVHELLQTVFPLPFEKIEKLLRGAGSWEGDLRQSTRDGDTVFVSSRWVARSAENNRLQIVEINRDMTDRTKMKDGFASVNRNSELIIEKLQRSERTFRALVESAPDAMVVADGNGRIVLLDAQAEKQFGYSLNELVGQSVEKLIPALFRIPKYRSDYLSRPSVRPLKTGLDFVGLRKNGEQFPVEISLSRIETSEGVFISSAIRDVSLRKRHETALNEENTRLRDADRAKDLFLATMSHELRGPLQVIVGFADLLAEEVKGPLNFDQKRYVKHVMDGSQHLLDLLNDFLDLSKIKAGEMSLRLEIFDVSEAVEEAVSSIQLKAESKSIRLETCNDGCRMILADRLRFKQIVCNLLGNGIKFTPQGGSVRVDAAERGGFIEISVTDTGIGIAREQHEAVFDRFFQVGVAPGSPQLGTGLGLSITRALVEHHGGRIWLESERGSGSRFTFTIPSAAPQVALAGGGIGA